MPNFIDNVYPKDLTMALASNHIENETKTFTTAADRIFVPDGGPFFSQSLIIKDNNGRLLQPQVEYQLLYLNESASVESGRDVVCVINVLTQTVPFVVLDYRVVGGAYGNTVNAIIQELTNAGPIQRTVDWNLNVYSKPAQFPPAPHYHTPDTFTEWKSVYTQLEGIRKAILVGDDPSWESHYNYINRVVQVAKQNIQLDLSNYASKDYVTQSVVNIDLTNALSSYYTKSQVNDMLTGGDGALSALEDNIALMYYSRTQSDGKYATIETTYTKLESDGRFAKISDTYNKLQSDNKYATNTAIGEMEIRLTNAINAGGGGTAVDFSNYYTKAQNYSKDETYAKAQTYSKTEVDALFTAAYIAINKHVPTYRIVNRVSNYTLVIADLMGDSIIRTITTNPITITLPAANNEMKVGHTVTIRQANTGKVTINSAPGVTIVPDDSLELRRVGTTATFVYVGNNNYDLITELV